MTPQAPTRPQRTSAAPAAMLKLETSIAPPTTGAIEALLTAADVARMLAVRPKRVYELGIPAVRISEKSLRWRRSDLDAWLEQRRTTS